MDQADQEAERRADLIFDELDDYSKGVLAQQGTAFTTYEENGEEVCAALNRRARAWRAAIATREGC
jgi:hypothetical protein